MSGLLLFVSFLLNTLQACGELYTYTLNDPKASYLEYRQWDATDVGEMQFRFKTHKPYGLLLYSDNSRLMSSGESYITLKMIYGKLSLTVQMGSEDYLSQKKGTVGRDLADLEWHRVVIARNRRETKLTVDDREMSILVNDGEEDKLLLNSGVFVGGISNSLADVLIDRTVMTIPRFTGCIEDIRFKSGTSSDYQRPLVAAHEASPGCMDACENVYCQNDGRCLNLFTVATCDCIGTGYEGSNCTVPSPIIFLDQDTYLAVNVAGPLQVTSSSSITFRFRSQHASGIIMAASSGKDHLLVELVHDVLRLSIDLGGGHQTLEIGEGSLSDKMWHLVEITRDGRSISLDVDRQYSVNSTTPGLFTNFDLDDLLYIGGHPSSLHMPTSKSTNNFTGCLQHVYYNGVNLFDELRKTERHRFQSHGAAEESCSMETPKQTKMQNKKDSRTNRRFGTRNIENDVFQSTTVSGADPTTDGNPLHKDSASRIPSERTRLVRKTLSKSDMAGIITGIVLGMLLLLAAMVCLGYHLKHRYTGVFVSSSIRESRKYTNGHAHTALYVPHRTRLSPNAEMV